MQSFEDVKRILDAAIAGFEQRTQRKADLSDHGDPGHGEMAWKNKKQLLSAWGHNRQLIQPEVIGNGHGEDANLVIDLRKGFGANKRMPLGGPFVTDADIQLIVDWINAGCPD